LGRSIHSLCSEQVLVLAPGDPSLAAEDGEAWLTNSLGVTLRVECGC